MQVLVQGLGRCGGGFLSSETHQCHPTGDRPYPLFCLRCCWSILALATSGSRTKLRLRQATMDSLCIACESICSTTWAFICSTTWGVIREGCTMLGIPGGADWGMTRELTSSVLRPKSSRLPWPTGSCPAPSTRLLRPPQEFYRRRRPAWCLGALMFLESSKTPNRLDLQSTEKKQVSGWELGEARS